MTLTLAGGQVLVAGRFLVADVRIEGSAISAVGASVAAGGEVVDCHGRYIVPGLIDLHVHGAGGRTFTQDVDAGRYEMIARAHASTGTTSICPTVTSAPPDQMLAAVALVADLCERDIPGGATFAGIHIEGPFLAAEQCGGHPVEHLQQPSVELAARLVDAGRGWVRMFTLAPELPGALDVIEYLTAQGIHVSAGHTGAGSDAVMAGMTRGLAGVTHVFNNMPPISSQDPGPAGIALGSELYAGMIADGQHLNRDTARLLLHTRRHGQTYITTDTSGSCRDPGDSDPPGSEATHLSTMVRHLMRDLDTPPEVAVAMATEVPAQILRLADRGHIRPGAAADVLVIERFKVDSIVLRGHMIEHWPNYSRL